ncbi:MAG: hypothetical protein PF961_02770 [Planctomycetota bacterium]|nr:hypothetical protein [Planctomycetota bacterium]
MGLFNSTRSRQHPLLRWGERSCDGIVFCENRVLVDGLTGEPVLRFATPEPAGLVIDATGQSGEHARVSSYLLKGHVGDLTGIGSQDLILASNPGGVLWIYANPATGTRGDVGLGANVTLY